MPRLADGQVDILRVQLIDELVVAGTVDRLIVNIGNAAADDYGFGFLRLQISTGLRFFLQSIRITGRNIGERYDAVLCRTVIDFFNAILTRISQGKRIVCIISCNGGLLFIVVDLGKAEVRPVPLHRRYLKRRVANHRVSRDLTALIGHDVLQDGRAIGGFCALLRAAHSLHIQRHMISQLIGGVGDCLTAHGFGHGLIGGQALQMPGDRFLAIHHGMIHIMIGICGGLLQSGRIQQDLITHGVCHGPGLGQCIDLPVDFLVNRIQAIGVSGSVRAIGRRKACDIRVQAQEFTDSGSEFRELAVVPLIFIIIGIHRHGIFSRRVGDGVQLRNALHTGSRRLRAIVIRLFGIAVAALLTFDKAGAGRVRATADMEGRCTVRQQDHMVIGRFNAGIIGIPLELGHQVLGQL